MKRNFGLFLLVLFFFLLLVPSLEAISSQEEKVILKLKMLKIQLVSLQKNSQSLTVTLKLQNQKFIHLENYNQQIEKQLVDSLNQIEQLQNLLNNKEISLTNLETKVQELKSQVAQLQEDLETLSDQLTTLSTSLKWEKIKIGGISFMIGVGIGTVLVLIIK